MSNLAAEVTLDWGDGTYLFRLTVAGLLELEEKTSSPFAVVHQRLESGTYGISDLRETIRLGLIGGGMTPPKALALVRHYVDERPKAESWKHAVAIHRANLVGFAVGPLGNQQAAPSDESPSASTPPPSTETQPLSAELVSKISDGFRFGSMQPR